jgi:hypothetical protein
MIHTDSENPQNFDQLKDDLKICLDMLQNKINDLRKTFDNINENDILVFQSHSMDDVGCHFVDAKTGDGFGDFESVKEFCQNIRDALLTSHDLIVKSENGESIEDHLVNYGK